MRTGLWEQIASFIAGIGGYSFDRLAIDLFQRQYQFNEPYRRYVDACGVSPESVLRWRDIPAAPAAAFKVYDLSCAPASACSTVFHSSGTTVGTPSRHWMDNDALRLYEISLTHGYKQAVGGSGGYGKLWAIMPPPDAAPNSSLTHMAATLGAEAWFWDNWSELATRLDELKHPVILFGTGFAFVSLFDCFPNRRWRLPEGSVVMNTGGFKGRTREVPRDQFYRDIRQKLGVRDTSCAAEYGMSEMSSQFYSVGEDGEFLSPRWLFSRIIDPETGTDVARGTPGLLRHYDLANWNSVCAIQTQDLAVASGSGFRLLGRAPGSEVRGCSLTVEELWNRE